ncbi:MAG TPA: ABC transporter ATP-binding protein [Gaiellaceae bacterium]|nr:ABC transporter ATP-binding protein [Gaiellaceae bacterium]
MRSDTVLEVSDLAVGYLRHDGSTNQVVSGVSFRLERGAILGLAGESGCGKSTSALAAIGYRPLGSRIIGGRSLLGDLDLLALPSSKLRDIWGSRIAYVAQSAALALNPALTVGHQLAQPLAIHLGLRGAKSRARQLELLEAMGLPDPPRALRRYPFQFSGGQQQRIALALALSCKPDVLVLDEPTTGLDVTTQARITELLRAIVRELGVGCLYVSHDLSLLGTLADRLAVMYAGEIVESGPALSVATNQRHPYTQALLAAVPSIRRPRVLVGIPGRPPVSVVHDSCAYVPRCPYAQPACVEAHPELRDPGDGHLARCVRLEEVERQPSPGHELARAHRKPDVLLSVHDVHCAYGRNEVVKGVSLDVRRAERVGIVGESGSGKSTLLRAIAGLHRPSAGSICLRGAELAPVAVKRPRSVRREIQLVFQNPDSSLNPRHTIFDIVVRPIRLFRDDVPRAGERAVVQELLDSVKLPTGLLYRYPAELSGGQRQRVALARAFAAQPTVLLCDEVTSALDVSVQATILELIAELSEQTETAVIWVSHDLAVVRTIADRALVMREGEVCEEGTTDELFAAAKHAYTQQLLAAIPELQPPAAVAEL